MNRPGGHVRPGGTDHQAQPEGDGALVGFKSHLRPTIVPDEAVYLMSRRGVTVLHGAHAETLVPLLDGTRSLAAVLRDAAPAVGAADAEAAVRALADAGLVRFRPPGADGRGAPLAGDPAAEAYWDLTGLDGPRAAAEVALTAVRVEALPGLDPTPVVKACLASGIRVAEPGESAGLSLVLCDDYLSPRLAEVDAAHRAAGRPWLLAKLCGVDPWVGPVFRPRDGPCWSCLASRLRGHRHSERPVQRALGLEGPPSRPDASLAAGRSLAVDIAVLETAKWLAGMRDPARSVIRTLDTLRLQTGSHPVDRLPQCACCGEPGLVARCVSAPFRPVSRPKADQDVNGHRALTAEQMLDRYGHLVDPVTGVVKEIRRAPRSPGFVNSYLSGHNLAMGSHNLAGLRSGLRALSGGKGLTETEARTSALCEAVERYSGTRHGDEPVVRDSYRALGAAALHPNSCQLYDERQFRTRERWNAAHSRFQYVSEPFDERSPTDWTPVWSLTAQKQRLLPTSMLYFADGQGAPDGLWADSNGNAAGSSPEDALVQGFLELVERDAVALWWYNRTRQPAVDLDAFDEPYIDRLRSGYRQVGREMWVLDLTSDFGIPVMAALSRRTDKPAQDVIFGFGAHFDPRLALRRALTEMGQLLPSVCEAAADGSGYRVDDPEPRDWWQRATPANQPYLSPDPSAAARGPGHWPYTPRPDLLDDVTAVTELVGARGMELLVLDQSRPDLGLPVVKVIVPGLRHFWARLGPGRLYDAPVQLGRLDEPTCYDDLNPVPLFV
ncbi:TOMM precursor leader peptide-binding protein [Streptomyces sp. NBC_01754]|uniref:TOMM precursor leader peptide-binding protein n=1 Tax=Streptomyces sp. NBC_01754 TaxID=2975930 RepID=UPI002DD8835D|nr:TOMM precursor leader peptide-binding protein [Streptomyces sp. NBC_01754]WSC95552.1 TOMM precursor leader peptide-binding protein [Streptomyces sp. NBC_01754]